MRKQVLVLFWSQTGQVERLARSIAGPLEEDGRLDVTYEQLRPREGYPFPWPVGRFLEVMPEAVCEVPPSMVPLACDVRHAYDLIILAYQPWFLSPSLPITGFLASADASILQGTPVVTVIGCRGMWLTAHEQITRRLVGLGARLIDNVCIADRAGSLASFLSTPRWLFTGRRSGALLPLPVAGIADVEITAAQRFGRRLRDALAEDAERGNGPLLAGLGAVRVDPRLIGPERLGRSIFAGLAPVIRTVSPERGIWRQFLVAVVFVCIIAIAAVLMPVRLLVAPPLRRLFARRVERIRVALEAPSGSDRSLIEPDTPFAQ